MRLIPAYICFFLCISLLHAQDYPKKDKNIFPATRSKEQQKKNQSKTATVGCPTGMSLTGMDTSGSFSVLNGATVSCLSKPFYVFANAPSSILDSINDVWYPCLQVRLIYNSLMQTSTTLSQYEGGVYTSCLGPGASCGFPVGSPSFPLTGSSWSYYHAYLNPAKSHAFVFSNAAATGASTVTVKSCWTNQVFATGVWPGATSPNYTISIPASTNIGRSTITIAPTVTNTLAFQDLNNARCYVNPQLLSLGTYTLTYTFKDTICAGATATFTFTVGPPIATWTAPHGCLPGSCINLNATLNASAVGGGTWTGTGVTSSTSTPQFCPSISGLGNFNVTYSVGTGTCSNTYTNTISVNTTPTITATSASVCPGFSSPLTVSGASAYVWNPSFGLNTTSGANVVANPSVTTNYTVIGTSNFCTGYTTSNLVVYPKPIAHYNSSPVPAFINNPTVTFTDISTGAPISFWNWTFGDGGTSSVQNPVYTYSSIGNFTSQLVITSVNSCKDSVIDLIIILSDQITAYNSFSPNGDGLNDIFEIDNIDQFGPNHVYIYNRWGQLLWDKTGYDNKTVFWDGKDNKGNALSPGTYFYIIEVDGRKTQKHWIELTK
jgi:gliding motility-associated-like protein